MLLSDPKGTPMSVVPKPEYPRPDRDRSERWATLNGTWQLTSIDGVADILVPFAWETPASGIGRTWLEHATYSREVTAPAEWTDARILVCFGAVHHRAVVALDGVVVGEHVGGYTSFEFDVTHLLQPGVPSVLTVEVDAPADKRAIPHGKQRSVPRDDYDGVSFTATSGIWQSVWLEARGRDYLASIAVRGDSLDGFAIDGVVVGDAPVGREVRVRVIEGSATGEELVLVADAEGRVRGRLALTEPRTWAPAHPHLYRLDFETGSGAGADRVVVTAGLRRIETRGERLLLNGERFVMRGVLDQGYWP
jgi:beta-galactosidase/beta-glucuronidase